MFTGLIGEVGRVERIDRSGDGVRLRIAARLAAELAQGDSVAVNGVCLTAAATGDGAFEADVMNQTTSVTTIGGLAEGDEVNLEPALRASDRLGGHIVQGHVDAVAEVADVAEDGIARRLTVSLPEELTPLVVERGSIALDGVSLTVAEIAAAGPQVSLIPETLERTTLGALGPGDSVNVECDVVARYVQRMVNPDGR